MRKHAKLTAVLIILVCSFAGQEAHAQLDQTFKTVFDFFLKEKLALSGTVHGNHYFPAADRAEQLLTPALNGLIASNISSFPLSSTIAGLSLDVSTGRPVLTSESLGPIFAETATTIGKGNVNFGISFSHLSLNRFRGLSVEDMRFSFTHEDVNPLGSFGDPIAELDYIDIFPNLNINSSIYAFILTAGITRNIDISLALPIVNVSMSGTAKAVINSFTYGRVLPDNPAIQGAFHRLGGDLLNPQLVDSTSYDVSTSGVGDIAIRLKYVFRRRSSLNLAVLADVRMPTGDEQNFLGTGKANIRFLWIMSSKLGDFNPHINIGYDQRGGAFDSDELEYTFGFDHKLSNAFTFALDLIGTYDLDEGEAIELFPGAIRIQENFEGGSLTRIVDLSNIPSSLRDNTIDLAIGLRLAPSEKVVLMGNLLTPLDNGGLRSNIVTTFGISISL